MRAIRRTPGLFPLPKLSVKEVNPSPKALFLSPDGKVYPDYLICSGTLPPELNGKSCPYSQNGRLPDPFPLDDADPIFSPDKGQPGDL